MNGSMQLFFIKHIYLENSSCSVLLILKHFLYELRLKLYFSASSAIAKAVGEIKDEPASDDNADQVDGAEVVQRRKRPRRCNK